MVLPNNSGVGIETTTGLKSQGGKGRRRRAIGHAPSNGDAARRAGSPTDGGLVGAMFRRQATGRRGGGGGGDFLLRREILFAQGQFKKRVRRQLEGVPEMIVEIRKALSSDNSSALFVAVRAALTKLVEGTSASFDLPPRQDSSISTSVRNAASNHHFHGHPGGGAGAEGDGVAGAGGGGHHHGGGEGHRHGDEDEDDPYHSNGYPRVRRLDRDVFVALGGPELLIEVLRGPQSPADARFIPADIVAQDTPVWNITLYILKELCFTDPDLSERFGSPELILFLLTMMGHPGVFDNAVGLVEEILAVKSNTYFLGEVPELHSLVENMSSQQLAHFSRVLALLVFEPEYRQLMESAHVLRSMELLQLRRDRVVRADSVIDKNQALVLSAPNLLPRLMELLRIMNYNPPLAMFHEHHGMEIPDHQFAQIRIRVAGGEVQVEDRRRVQQEEVASEWNYFSELRTIAGADAAAAGQAGPRGIASAVEPSRQESHRRRGGGGTGSTGGGGGSAGGGGDSRIVNFFRSIFRRGNNSSQRPDAVAVENDSAVAAIGPVGGEGPGGIAFRDGGVGQLAAAAVGAMGVDGAAGTDGLANFAVRDLINFLNPAFAAPNAVESMVSFERALAWSVGGPLAGSVGGGGNGRVRGRRRLQLPSADEAREELQLNGLMLAPHQVEVLFVLCTLLGARRKGEAHEALANLGLIEVLDSMFDRLSWGVPSRQEGPHGAHCDCNPESALRVQYLRLVHNFLDRDSNNNPLKRLLLSAHERQLFASGRFMPNPNGSGNVVFVESGSSKSDPPQSPYAWRGRASSGLVGESDAERAAWVDTRGLLSKIVDVFMKEPMDSLYRFWLASCVEAFLRGGTTQEQLFIAGGGLLGHLVKEITSDGVWCAGSLQTAFDLLGELCKGNREVLEMLEASMTEKQLRRFLEVMVDNLVDSNVFMRSLVLSVEHSAFRQEMIGRGLVSRPRSDNPVVTVGAGASASLTECAQRSLEGSKSGEYTDDGSEEMVKHGELFAKDDDGFQGLGAGEEPCYLGHTWFDVQPREISLSADSVEEIEDREEEKDEEGDHCSSGARVHVCETFEESRVSCPAATANEDLATSSQTPSQQAANGGPLSEASRNNGLDELSGLDGFSDSVASNRGGAPERSQGSEHSRACVGAKEGEQEDTSASKIAVELEKERSEIIPMPVTAAGSRRTMWGAGDGVTGFTRLQVFLKHNTPQLVRDLMGVVNLETINHENICCLNTAVLILIFADRRGELAQVLREVRRLPAGKKVSDVDGDDNHESESTGEDQGFEERDNDDDDNDDDSLFGSYSRNRRRRAKNTSRESGTSSTAAHEVSEGDDGAGGDAVDTPPADGETVLQGFRRLLWFWEEYYMRGGRDRLSLEFSTHVKFWAWKRVIRLLCADDGSPTSLVAVPLRLPRSPYDTVPPPPPRTT